LVWVTDCLADDRPNILFILADDQSPYSLSAYGNEVCHTPNLDRLAKDGMTFDGAHHMGAWTGAVCTASRTMIMNGRTVWHVPGAKATPLENDEQYRQEAAQQSMPVIFSRAGYETFRTCKQGNSYDEANRLFQVSKIQNPKKKYRKETTNSDWHGDRAVEYLESREAASTEKPFLMYFGFTHPHDPRNGKSELLEKYGAFNDAGPFREGMKPHPKSPELPVNYLPEHPFHHGHPGLRDEEKVQGVMKQRDPATVRNEKGREYACIENMDHQIGRVLDKLEAMGELDNTYVIFTADHGIAVGRHGLMGKQNLYEHTWRVPMLVMGPGVEAGSRNEALVYLHEVLPTICDLIGVEAPEAVEGKSFAPVIRGDADKSHEVLYGVYSGGTKPGIRSVRNDRWKLITYDVLDGEVQETQLFDLQENPNELLEEHHAPEVVKLTGNQPEPQQKNL
ncbi:MAG: sulfatase-like hydrolase/transferase, partial [Lacipirellulaceae bacterium]